MIKARVDRIRRRIRKQSRLNSALIMVERLEGMTEGDLELEIDRRKREIRATCGLGCRVTVLVIADEDAENCA